MSKLKIKTRGISMEVVGKDDLIQREREAFLEYAENHKGIQIGVTAIPVERLRPFPEHMNCKCSCDSEEPATETEDKQEGSIDYIRTVKRHHKMNWQELAEKIKKGIIPVEVGATVSCELTDGTPAEFVVTDVTDQYVRFETRNFIGGEVEWNEQDTGEIIQCKPSKKYLECKAIKESSIDDMEEKLKEYGCRQKFPAKTADLRTRWCSAYLKIMVADSVMANMDSLNKLEEIGGKRHKFPAKGGTHQGRWCSGNLKAAVQDSVTANLDKARQGVKILVVSGERRGESSGRSKYNEIEIHRTNAEKKLKRTAHQWRPVIDYSEKDVWEVLKRHKVNPHPCYRAGWNRCSCAMCIFSTPKLFAGIRELYPEDFEALRNDENILEFTLDNKCNLDEFVGDTESCVYHGDKEAIRSLITGEFTTDDIYVKGDWLYPAGAFHGAEGGPC